MAIFKGFADNLKKGSTTSTSSIPPKKALPKKSGSLFSGFANSLKSKEKAPQPIPEPAPKPTFTPPKQALSTVFKAAGPYIPGGPSAKPTPVVPAPVPPVPPVAPTATTAPTKGLGARRSALPVQKPASIQATGKFSKFAPIVQKTSSFLPTTSPEPAPDKIEAPKPSMFKGLADNVLKAGNTLRKVSQGPAGYFAPDLTQKSAVDTLKDTATGFKTGVTNAKDQYANLADKTTKFYKTAYFTPGATNAEKTAAAMDFAASLVTDLGGGTFGVGLETAAGFSPNFKFTKEKTLDRGAELANKAGQFVGEEVVPILPVSDKTKELIQGPTERLTAAGLMALAFGVAGRAASKSGKSSRTTIDVAKKIEEIKTKPLTPNEIVASSKEALGFESDASGQQTRNSLKQIRDKFDELSNDPTITPEELQVARVAKQVLDDYARMPQSEFLDTYRAPIETVQKAAMRAPSLTPDYIDRIVSTTDLRPEPRLDTTTPKPEANKFVETPRFDEAKSPDIDLDVKPEVKKVEVKPFIATASAKVATEGATKTAKATAIPSRSVTTKTPAVPKVEAIKPVKFDSKNLVHKSVMTDILGAENAAKIANTGDLSSGVIFGRRPSSLPKWIPSELRRGPLVKSVMQHINDGTLPVRAAENQLYRVITNQMKGESTAPARTRVPRVEAEVKPRALPEQRVERLTKVVFDEANPKHFEVLEQMANAKAGVREGIQTETGRVQVSTKSTFPKWIPEDLRQKPLLDAVSTHIYKGTVPKNPRETRLYNIVAQEMGVNLFDKKALEIERANLFDPFATKEENAAILAEFDRLNGLDTPKAKEQLKKFINDRAKSRVYERLQKETGELSEDLTYQKQNLKENAEKAVDLIATDKDKAYRVAMGLEKPPEGQTATAVNIAMAEKALSEGNNKLYADLVRARSIDQTRRGQELVAEKGSITDNSVSRYTKELLAARLEQLGNSYLANVKSNNPLKKTNIEKGRKAKATEIIDNQVAKVSDRIKKAKVMDIAEAQKFLDSLAC